MKTCFKYFFVVAALWTPVEFAHCSDRTPDQSEDYVDVPFEKYSEGAKSLRVVLGCGQKHRERTCGGFEHDHDEAYTVDLKPSPERQNPWEVSKPHRYGDAFEKETWKGIPKNTLDNITTEHLVLFPQVSFKAIREFIREGFDPKKAKEKAEFTSFNWLVDLAAIHLKAGGTLTLLPAFHPHGSASFCCKGIFQKLLRSLKFSSIEETTALLLSDISDFFPFDRGFSHMTIRFYQVLGERSSERTSKFISEYSLNMSSKAEEKSLQKNKDMARLICKERSALNFVTVTLTKEED